MSDSVLRAAVIGAGVGRGHARGYKASKDVQLAAVCDLDPARVQSFADEFGIGAEGRFSDYHQMLATIHPDIVSIALPNFLHAEVTIAALEAGAHVICEKPMAIHTADASAMVAAAERTGRELAVCYNYRYHADTQWAKRTIAAGALGEIYHVDAAWRRETGIPGRGWFGNKSLSGGGALIDLGVHVLDLSLWWMDFPAVQTVSAATRTKFGPGGFKTWGRKPGQSIDLPFDVDDGATGFLRLANGAHMVLRATWAEHRPPQDDLIRIEIQGTRGSLVLRIPNYKHDQTLTLYTEIEGEPVTTIPSPRKLAIEGHEGLVSATVEAIRSGNPLPADGVQGLAAVRVLEAMYHSAEQQAEVRLTV
ncbi:MAG: Gfo/Idh/MocA family protein [Aggregatilineales bacterium]